jgi:hypothetical protein
MIGNKIEMGREELVIVMRFLSVYRQDYYNRKGPTSQIDDLFSFPYRVKENKDISGWALTIIILPLPISFIRLCV